MKSSGIRIPLLLLLLLSLLALAGCATNERTTDSASSSAANDAPSAISAIANLLPADLEAPLQVVATTSIIGDVAHQVGGDRIHLTVLLPAGSDPHAWVPTPRDLVTLSGADLLLMNGVGLEEGLIATLGTISGPQIVSVNEHVAIYVEDEHAHAEGEHADDEHADDEHADDEHADDEHADDEHADDESSHDHSAGDPHTWQDVANVRIWAENIASAFSALDPENQAEYAANADAYRTQLAALADEIAALMDSIPTEARKFVTDHDDLGYFARTYGFTVEGTVIPSISAMASVSARTMAALQEQIRTEGVRAIFVGNTVNRDLADQIAADTGVQVIPLFTDALSAEDGPAPTYIDMMRYNANAIASALID